MNLVKLVRIVNQVKLVSRIQIETLGLSQIISWHLMCSYIKVFQYDPGSQKHASELNFVKHMFSLLIFLFNIN